MHPRNKIGGGDRGLAAHFDNSSFDTLDLSPRDYHCVHIPCTGKLTRMIYVPVELFSVNPTTARGVVLAATLLAERGAFMLMPFIGSVFAFFLRHKAQAVN